MDTTDVQGAIDLLHDSDNINYDNGSSNTRSASSTLESTNVQDALDELDTKVNAVPKGTVTSVNTGVGLTGGNITSSGTISTYVPRLTQSCNNIPGQNRVNWIEYSAGSNYNLPDNLFYHIMTIEGDDVKYATQLALAMTGSAKAYIRQLNNNTWSEWIPIHNTDTSKNICAGTWWNTATSHNVNDAEVNTTHFVYTSHGAPTNGILLTLTNSDKSDTGSTNAQGYRLQIVASYNTDLLYFRTRNGDSGTWTAWKRCITADETATTSANGLMTTAMVTKLNGIATGATANVNNTYINATNNTNSIANKTETVVKTLTITAGTWLVMSYAQFGTSSNTIYNHTIYSNLASATYRNNMYNGGGSSAHCFITATANTTVQMKIWQETGSTVTLSTNTWMRAIRLY